MDRTSLSVRKLHEFFESQLRVEFAEQHHREFVLLFHDDVSQALAHAELTDHLRQTALFFESMEAAVDRAYEIELEPGYFMVAECIRPEEREPAVFHSRVA